MQLSSTPREPDPHYLHTGHPLVVVVDHDGHQLDVLAAPIHEAGWRAIMASEDSFATRAELLHWIGRMHPDAVVYDLNEPDDDHLETYGRIAIEEGPTRVVALSGSARVLDRLRGDGHPAIFGNPPDLGDLMSEVSAAFDAR